MALIVVGPVNLVTLHLVPDQSGRLDTRYMSYAYTVLKSVIAILPLRGSDDKMLSWKWRLDARRYLRIRFEKVWVPLVPSTFHMLSSLGFDIREISSFVAVGHMVGSPFSETAEWLLPGGVSHRLYFM